MEKVGKVAASGLREVPLAATAHAVSIHRFRGIGPRDTGSPFWSFVVLGAAFAFEGASFRAGTLAAAQRGSTSGVGVAHHLFRDADPALRAVVLIRNIEGMDGVLEMLTMRLAPDQVLVAARVDVASTFSPEELEEAADEVERRTRAEYPEVRHVFLDPTPGTEGGD